MIRTEIQIPELNKDSIVTQYAQQRPFREGGNLIHKINLKGKAIIHNYGHGGAGVSLAPGSAIEAVALAYQNLINSKSVAVIGSGIIGLFNCYEILKKYPNIKVTIYSQRIPVFGEKNNDKMITSQVAPGFWLPYHYGSNNESLHTNLSSLSLKQFYQLSKQQKYKASLNEVEMFDITDEEYKHDYYHVLTEQLRPSYRQYKIRLNQKTTVQCRTFTTIRIDMQPFLQVLMKDLKQKGTIFIEKTLTQDTLLQLKQDVIFNCSGLGSKILFNDNNLKGIKGHLIEFPNRNPQKYNFFLRANIGKQFVNYYMHNSRIILGLTRQNIDDCKVDINQVNHLLHSHELVLKKFGLSPLAAKL